MIMLVVLVILDGEYEAPRKVLQALVNTPPHPEVNWMRSEYRSRKSPCRSHGSFCKGTCNRCLTHGTAAIKQPHIPFHEEEGIM